MDAPHRQVEHGGAGINLSVVDVVFPAAVVLPTDLVDDLEVVSLFAGLRGGGPLEIECVAGVVVLRLALVEGAVTELVLRQAILRIDHGVKS